MKICPGCTLLAVELSADGGESVGTWCTHCGRVELKLAGREFFSYGNNRRVERGTPSKPDEVDRHW